MTPQTSGPRSGIHLIGGAVIATITVLAFFVVIAPWLRMQTEHVAMGRELTEQLRLTEELDRTRAGLEGELERIRLQLAESEMQLQPSRHLNARIAHIIEHAAADEVDIHETRPGTVRDHERYQTVPILLKGRGSYSSCAAFLHRLHESLPDTGVMEFELAGNPADRLAAATFRFNLIWYAEPASAGVP